MRQHHSHGARQLYRTDSELTAVVLDIDEIRSRLPGGGFTPRSESLPNHADSTVSDLRTSEIADRPVLYSCRCCRACPCKLVVYIRTNFTVVGRAIINPQPANRQHTKTSLSHSEVDACVYKVLAAADDGAGQAPTTEYRVLAQPTTQTIAVLVR